jgi:hypothetical protein
MLVGFVQVKTVEEELAHPHMHVGGASHKGPALLGSVALIDHVARTHSLQ